MNTSESRPSATLYQFPTSGRSASATKLRETHGHDRGPQREPAIVWGSSWYHEDALREADSRRKS